MDLGLRPMMFDGDDGACRFLSFRRRLLRGDTVAADKAKKCKYCD